MDSSEQTHSQQENSFKRIFLFSFLGIIIATISSTGTYLYLQPKQTFVTQPPSTQTPSPIATESIKKRVLELFDTYKTFTYPQDKPIDLNANIQNLYAKGYITQGALYALERHQGQDPVLCTQGGSTYPLEIDTIAVGKDMAVILVKQYYEGTQTFNYITATMNLKDQKVTSLSCNN